MVKVIDQFHLELTDKEKENLLLNKEEIKNAIKKAAEENKDSKIDAEYVRNFCSYYYSFPTYDLSKPRNDFDKTIELVVKFLPLTEEDINDLRGSSYDAFRVLLNDIDSLLEL